MFSESEIFIRKRLSFKGKVPAVAIAVSFLVMIAAVSISAGFRKEIRNGVSDVTSDVQLCGIHLNSYGDADPVSAEPSYMGRITAVEGVDSISPVIWRAGIVKSGDSIHGVMLKGTDNGMGMEVSIPRRLSSLLGLKAGDRMLTYFIGEKVKARSFTVRDVYNGVIDSEDNLVVYADIATLRRLEGWDDTTASSIEIRLSDKYRTREGIKAKAEEIGAICLTYAGEDDDTLVATSSVQRYGRLFDWLDLLDLNVVAILVLMTIVAGFNMISGMLILLLRSVRTIGLLKTMGMSDRGIADVYLGLSAKVVLRGIAIGNALALLFCFVQDKTHMLTLDPDNYFVSFVPVSVNIPAILAADAAAFAAVMLLLYIPSRFISKVDPAETVRVR